jgi:hypothetical protein
MCLGRIVTKTDDTEEEVREHTRQMNGTFIQLCAVWKNKNITRRMKLFSSITELVLLYGCEKWKVIEPIIRQLQVFINRCLWRILSMRWPEVMSNEDLWEMRDQQLIMMM